MAAFASEHLGTPSLGITNPEQAAIAGCLLTDFRNTFRFSQGRVFLQNILGVELGSYYRNNWSVDMQAQIPEALVSLEDKVGNLKPPGIHTKAQRSDYTREFSKRFVQFRDGLSNNPTGWPELHNDPTAPQIVPQHSEDRLSLIADLSIDRDVEFIANGRYDKVDPARSFTRDYILELQPTQSDAYDDIFHRTHRQLVDNNARRRMALVQRLWEQNHPGETFYSEEFLSMEPSFMRRSRVSAFIGQVLPDSVLRLQRGGK